MINGGRFRGSVKRSAYTEKTIGGFPLEDTLLAAPDFTVDGIPAMPGETWQAYHDRALSWITIEARTIPANRRSLPLWGVAGLIAIMTAIGFLISRI